ncbi:Transamidase GatB domain protein [Legionella pneumophila]|nr:Transamidase GatB domain protein [Legionella pneumophila]
MKLKELICDAIKSTGAEKMSDMGKVMAILKKLQGRADMAQVSARIKAKLS